MIKLAAKIGIPVFLVTACLWAVYRFLGSDVAIIVSAVLSILLIIVCIVWILRRIFSHASTSKARREVESVAGPPSAVGSEEQLRLEGLQRSLNSALKVILESKLARGRKSSEALYSLPWILMLGPTDSGKTTALQECGVEFPYVASESRKPKKSGATSGCNYWFSRNAVVLDLEGRIATEEEEAEVFSGFLDQLKRARKERPLDGVVLTISLKEILDLPADQVEALAGSFRKRFDEMIRRLGIRFPVYILFTKCDQIEGFAEFFSGFRSRNRAQVWGATVSRDQTKHQPADQIFQSEFDRLAAALSSFRLWRMANEKNPEKLSRIYGFPSRFASLRKKLEDFVGALLHPSPYSERPMFRGFYFASAAGAIIAEEVHPQPEVDWDPGRRLSASQEQPASARSYFLETLFPRVIFADRPLAKPSVYTRLRRRLWLDIAFFATLALCAILLAAIIYSFTENRALIHATRSAALQLQDSGWNGHRESDLVAMQTLRQRLEEHAACKESGWTPRCLLYSGDDVANSARRAYFRRLRGTFIAPTANELGKRLLSFSRGAQSSASFSEFYSYLKAYLMMSEHATRADASFLKNTLAPIWKSFAPADPGGVAEQQLDFYAQQLQVNPELPLTVDSRLVSIARRYLAQYPAVERIFSHLKEEGNKKLPSFTLKDATAGKSLDYLNSSYEIPGVFTKTGWESYFRDAVGPASKEALMDDWVLGPAQSPSVVAGTADTNLENSLRQKYFDEYVEQWQKFLSGITVRSLTDLNDARAALDSFSQHDSALSRLLLSAADNTMLPKESAKGAGLSETLSGIGARIGLGSRIDRTQFVDVIANEFRPLHDVVTSPDDKAPSMSAQYIDALMNVQGRLRSLFGEGVEWDKVKLYADKIANSDSSNEFQKGFDITELIRRQCSTPSTRTIAPLLEQPLRETWAAILKEISHLLDGRWRTQIRDVFKRDLESGFPFNRSGEDVSLAALTQFLKPNNGTLEAFYHDELKMFLSPPGAAYVPKKLNGEQVDFSPAFLEFMGKMNAVRQAFFPPSSPEVSISFDLTPNSTPGVSGSEINIDGQLLTYRNEPLSPKRMTWPSKEVASQAKLSVSLGGSGERPALGPIDGEWAFFRLLSSAEIVAKNQTTYDVTWSMPSSSGSRVPVRYRLRATSSQNPFAKDFFSSIVCPERVSRAQAD